MRRVSWPLLGLVFLAAFAGGALLPLVPGLEWVNLDHPSRGILPLGPKGEFSLFYEHSIYGAPAREYYLLHGDKIQLLAVETPDPGVAAYYGFDSRGPLYPVHSFLCEMVLRVRMGKGEQVLEGAGKLHVRELGQPGDRILLGPTRCSVLDYLVWRYSRQGV